MRLKSFIVVAVLSSPLFAQTLDEAVQHSMITNPNVLFNTAKGLSAQEGIDKAKGAYYPTIDFNGGFGREYSLNPTTQAINGPGAVTLNRVESYIEMRQNLFAGGGIVNEVKRTEFLSQAQQLKTQGVAEDIALEAVNRYLLVILQSKLLDYATVNLREHRSVFSMIRDRSDAGIARAAELDQANARLAHAESNRIAAEANLREAKINFAKVVGSWPDKLVWPRVPKNCDLPSSLPKAIERGLEIHPGLKSTYADVKTAKSQYQVARAAYYPRVDFVLSASKNRNLDGLPGPNNDRMAMLKMNYNLFRGGSDDANVRQTAYDVQQAYESKNLTLINLRETIRVAWTAWTYAGLRLDPLRRNITASRSTRGAYMEQFKVGKRTLLDLLDSQNEFYEAQIEYARAQNDEVFSRYRILNGMGALLPYLQMRLPKNVMNNDVFTSAQTHVLLNREMDRVPYPDDSDKSLYLAFPVKNMETTPLTPAIVHKNTAKPAPVKRLDWYVSAGRFRNRANAIALVNRLQGQGFAAFMLPGNNVCSVLVGPFEYRGQAANTMERLKEIAHVPCVLVTFKVPPPRLSKSRFCATGKCLAAVK